MVELRAVEGPPGIPMWCCLVVMMASIMAMKWGRIVAVLVKLHVQMARTAAMNRTARAAIAWGTITRPLVGVFRVAMGREMAPRPILTVAASVNRGVD